MTSTNTPCDTDVTLQGCSGGDRREAEHARWYPHRAGAVRGARTQEVAVWRMERWRHSSEPHGGFRCAWVCQPMGMGLYFTFGLKLCKGSIGDILRWYHILAIFLSLLRLFLNRDMTTFEEYDICAVPRLIYLVGGWQTIHVSITAGSLATWRHDVVVLAASCIFIFWRKTWKSWRMLSNKLMKDCTLTYTRPYYSH